MTKNETRFPETQGSLVLKLRSGGDERTWSEFVAIYRPVIYRIARRRGLQDADAQDLAQKVLMSVARAIESYEPRENKKFRQWLQRVATNAIINAVTRKPKDQAFGGSAAGNLLHDHPEPSELTQEVRLEEEREMFQRAARLVQAEVAADSWRVFELAVVEGVPIEAAAAEVGKSVGAAYAARARVMKRLQAAVQRLEEGAGQ